MANPDLSMPDPGHVCSGDRVPVGGAHLYFERAGQGPPCLLLHGGFASHCS